MAAMTSLIGLGMTAAGALAANSAANKAAKDVRAGRQAQLNALMSGYTTAGGQLDQGYADAQARLAPFLAQGGQFSGVYADLMGINGPEARARAQQTITSDPLWAGQLGNEQMAAQRALNARGLGGSGMAALAGQRVLTERYGDVLNRFQQGAQQGAQVAGASADLSARYGSERAGLTYGHAQQQAGVHGNAANALATVRGAQANNMMGLASLGVSGMTPGFGGATAFGNMASGLNRMFGAGATAQSSPYPGFAPGPTYSPPGLSAGLPSGMYPGPR
jgi:hypothetical protein